MKIRANISIATLLLPLIAAGCDQIDFTGDHGNEGFTTPYNQSFPTSSWVNCTPDIASQDGGETDTCEFHHYAMGLAIHSEVRFVAVDNSTQENIMSLVQRSASGTAAAATNFNATIVMNYTVGTEDIPEGQAGHYSFTPTLRCWDGTLSSCGDGDALEGKTVRACGLAWLDGQQSQLSPGSQQYDGTESFVDGSGIADTDPQPKYEDMAGQATTSQANSNEEGGSPTTNSGVSIATLAVALLCSVYGTVL